MANPRSPPNGPEISSPRSSRAGSISSERPSLTGALTDVLGTTLQPAPAYVAVSAASEIVTNYENDHIKESNSDNVSRSPSPDADDMALFSDSALALVNQFLDYLLYNILYKSKGPSLGAIRPAILAVLKARLARDAMAMADEELEDLGGGEEDEEEELEELLDDSDWNLEVAFKRTRLRVMAYSRLGDMEDEEEERHLEREEAFHLDGELFQDIGLVTGAAGVYLSSVIEFLAKECLKVAGKAAYSRVQLKRKRAQQPLDAPARVVVQDSDVEKAALSPALSRLWRAWRKQIRSSTSPSSPAPSRGSFRAFGMTRTSSMRRRHSRETMDSAVLSQEDGELQSASRRPSLMEEVPEYEPSETEIAANIPLPMGDSDVDEIEVPGLAKEIIDEPETFEDDVVFVRAPRRLSEIFAPLDRPAPLLRLRSRSVTHHDRPQEHWSIRMDKQPAELYSSSEPAETLDDTIEDTVEKTVTVAPKSAKSELENENHDEASLQSEPLAVEATSKPELTDDAASEHEGEKVETTTAGPPTTLEVESPTSQTQQTTAAALAGSTTSLVEEEDLKLKNTKDVDQKTDKGLVAGLVVGASALAAGAVATLVGTSKDEKASAERPHAARTSSNVPVPGAFVDDEEVQDPVTPSKTSAVVTEPLSQSGSTSVQEAPLPEAKVVGATTKAPPVDYEDLFMPGATAPPPAVAKASSKPPPVDYEDLFKPNEPIVKSPTQKTTTAAVSEPKTPELQAPLVVVKDAPSPDDVLETESSADKTSSLLPAKAPKKVRSRPAMLGLSDVPLKSDKHDALLKLDDLPIRTPLHSDFPNPPKQGVSPTQSLERSPGSVARSPVEALRPLSGQSASSANGTVFAPGSPDQHVNLQPSTVENEFDHHNDPEAIGVARTSNVPIHAPPSISRSSTPDQGNKTYYPSGYPGDGKRSSGTIASPARKAAEPSVEQQEPVSSTRPGSSSLRNEVKPLATSPTVTEAEPQRKPPTTTIKISQPVVLNGPTSHPVQEPQYPAQGQPRPVPRSSKESVRSVNNKKVPTIYTGSVAERSSSSSHSNRSNLVGPHRGSVSKTAADAQSERDFDDLVRGAETVKYTLTPQNMRDIEGPSSPIQETRTSISPKDRPEGEHTRAGSSGSSGSKTSPVRSSPPRPVAPKVTPRVSSAAPAVSKPVTTPASPKPPPKRVVSLNTAIRRTGLIPRDARVLTESTRDFADYIRSTAPEHPLDDPVLFTTNVRNSQNRGSGVISPTSARKVAARRLEPREPTSQPGGTAELADFIRRGPASEDGQPRIPRTIAPFRTTMDSDELTNLQAESGAQSISQSANRLPPPTSMTGRNPPTVPIAGASRAAPNDGMPVRKRTRIKDPYAIDSDDDDEELDRLTALPRREQESLVDFLRNSEPPPGANQPKPLVGVTRGVNGTQSSQSANIASTGAVQPTSPRSTSSTSANVSRQRMTSKPAGGRQARTEAYSQDTGDLADFLRSSGPDPSMQSQPQPLMLSGKGAPRKSTSPKFWKRNSGNKALEA